MRDQTGLVANALSGLVLGVRDRETSFVAEHCVMTAPNFQNCKAQAPLPRLNFRVENHETSDNKVKSREAGLNSKLRASMRELH